MSLIIAPVQLSEYTPCKAKVKKYDRLDAKIKTYNYFGNILIINCVRNLSRVYEKLKNVTNLCYIIIAHEC